MGGGGGKRLFLREERTSDTHFFNQKIEKARAVWTSEGHTQRHRGIRRGDFEPHSLAKYRKVSGGGGRCFWPITRSAQAHYLGKEAATQWHLPPGRMVELTSHIFPPNHSRFEGAEGAGGRVPGVCQPFGDTSPVACFLCNPHSDASRNRDLAPLPRRESVTQGGEATWWHLNQVLPVAFTVLPAGLHARLDNQKRVCNGRHGPCSQGPGGESIALML